MSQINILVFPCGSEVGLEIGKALGKTLHVLMHGASSTDNHGRLAYSRYAEVPNIAHQEFNARFADLIYRWQIEILFATHDSVIEYLAPFALEWNVHLVNGDPESTRIARSKLATYELFSGELWVPRVFANLTQVSAWPALLKPDRGQGGQGVALVQNRTEAEHVMARLEEPLLCEYLPGEELTVDCFSDWKRCLLFVGPRSRERVIGGISMRSKKWSFEEDIVRIAEKINARMVLRGPWFFQLKKDTQGGWKLLEVSCRLSSSSVVHRAAGVNLPLMAVQDYMLREQQVVFEHRIVLIERCLQSVAELNYDFDTVYLDFDDTLVCEGRANPQAMRFVYRLLEMGKSIVLITRHQGTLEKAFAKAHISKSMFDEIFHLQAEEPKSSVIKGRAIFIDNHFPERLEVYQACGIPVFDVDVMEMLYP